MKNQQQQLIVVIVINERLSKDKEPLSIATKNGMLMLMFFALSLINIKIKIVTWDTSWPINTKTTSNTPSKIHWKEIPEFLFS